MAINKSKEKQINGKCAVSFLFLAPLLPLLSHFEPSKARTLDVFHQRAVNGLWANEWVCTRMSKKE